MRQTQMSKSSFEVFWRVLARIFAAPAACALALSAVSAVSAEAARRQTTMLVGDMTNFELPSFDDKSGRKEWELFGDKATYVDESRIDIDGMRLRLYDADAKSRMRAEITSPLARVNPSTKAVTGQSPIGVKADEFSLSGSRWDWDGAKKIVRVFGDVKINFFGRPKASPPSGTSHSAAPAPGDSSAAPSVPETSASPVGGVPAEGAKDIPQKGDSSKKSDSIRLFSDFASLDHSAENNVFGLEKNVRVDSGDMKIACDEMVVTAPKSGGGVRDISAKGNVKIERDKLSASSGSAFVVPSKSTALLGDSPSIYDASSKATLSGDKIFLDKSGKKVISRSSDSARARAVLLHVDDKGRKQTIVISADNIEMRDADARHEFDFKGNVKVSAPDFTAACDEMTAFSKGGGDSKAEIDSIKGKGRVKFSNDDGDAVADNIEILPKKSEVWLTGRASLRDSKRGTTLKSAVIIFQREKNSGVALSEPMSEKTGEGRKDSRVRLEISGELASAEYRRALSAPAAKKAPARARPAASRKRSAPTVVSSKILQFSRNGENMFFTFLNDVRIDSDSAVATCEKMEVFAKSDGKGSARVNKIVASNNVRLRQRGYEADSEIATIYPRLETDGADKSEHRYVELSVSPDNPGKRPSVTLPPTGNLGLDSSLASGKKPSNTVIKSDRQWLMSSPDGADKYFFEGNVSITGTDLDGECDRIEVVMKPPRAGAQKEIVQIIMRGNVKMSQALKEVECGRADLYVDEEMIVLSENPTVVNTQDNTRVNAPRIIYNKGRRKIIFEQDESSRRADSDADSDSGDSAGRADTRPTMTLPPLDSARRGGGNPPSESPSLPKSN
ncbi:MAG: hypothetical protein DBX55_03935 [Verrucomicrobia bacterium]|nr:MAG: hypothetical protein DBX55_03935 [Verrucomicrobiota bacterium]